MKISIKISGLRGKTLLAAFFVAVTLASGVCAFYASGNSCSKDGDRNCPNKQICVVDEEGTILHDRGCERIYNKLQRQLPRALPVPPTQKRTEVKEKSSASTIPEPYQYDVYVFIAYDTAVRAGRKIEEKTPDLISFLLGKLTVSEEGTGDKV